MSNGRLFSRISYSCDGHILPKTWGLHHGRNGSVLHVHEPGVDELMRHCQLRSVLAVRLTLLGQKQTLIGLKKDSTATRSENIKQDKDSQRSYCVEVRF